MAVTLGEYLNRVYLPGRPGLSVDYCRLLRATVRKLRDWAGRPIGLQGCDRALLAAWTAAGLAGGLRPSTVNDRVRMVRTLLLAAFDDGYLEFPPRRVRRVAEQHAPPEAWTLDECRALFAYLGDLPGKVGEVSASEWWTALVLTVYWTGCRIGALLAVDARDYTPGVGLIARQQKNGRPRWYRLPSTCCEAIERILPEAGLIWRWPFHRRRLFAHFRECIERAGLPAPRGHCQLFHRLRRTNLTYCAAVDPALAQRQADHRDWETTKRHYIDPRFLPERSAVDVLPDPLAPAGAPDLRIYR